MRLLRRKYRTSNTYQEQYTWAASERRRFPTKKTRRDSLIPLPFFSDFSSLLEFLTEIKSSSAITFHLRLFSPYSPSLLLPFLRETTTSAKPKHVISSCKESTTFFSRLFLSSAKGGAEFSFNKNIVRVG